MARKTTTKKTPPKNQTRTIHVKVVEDELLEDDAIALEPRQTVALKKGNGKRAMAREKEVNEEPDEESDEVKRRIIKKKEVEGHDAFYHLMADWLMKCYDDVSQMFMFSEIFNFVITKHDVYDVFMLPCMKMEVRMTSSKKKENPDEGLVEVWRARYNVGPKKEISLDRLRREMLDLVDGGNMFKRLCKAIESYEKFDTADVGGCLLFLQLVYFHRLSWKGNPAKRELPLVKHWTYDDIKDRVKEEKRAYHKNGGHFGIGKWQIEFYPISRDRPKVLYRLSVDDPHDLDAAAPKTITLPLAVGQLTDEELRLKYPDIRVLKWMTTKRNLELVSKLHNDMTKDLEAFVSVNVVLDEVVQAEEVENGEEARGDAVEDSIHANENTVVERFRRRYSRAAKKQGRKT
ncbi:hypothetical protein KSS87_001276 [Heliosperma pusillum]|nr:hypothetical protein KSS87_001276 [Heliosperma pusillum]